MPSHPAEARASSLLCLTIAMLLAGAGCLASQGVGPNADRPLERVDAVDLERFAGDWFVLEHIGLEPESEAHDEVETYTLREDGRIDVALRFRDGAFDGPERRMSQLAWVHDPATNAEWRIRPFWPLALSYLIIDLDGDYAWTVVGHPSKRWVWIMAREPRLDAETLSGIRGRLAEQGYDVTRLRRVPQRPLSERDD